MLSVSYRNWQQLAEEVKFWDGQPPKLAKSNWFILDTDFIHQTGDLTKVIEWAKQFVNCEIVFYFWEDYGTFDNFWAVDWRPPDPPGHALSLGAI